MGCKSQFPILFLEGPKDSLLQRCFSDETELGVFFKGQMSSPVHTDITHYRRRRGSKQQKLTSQSSWDWGEKVQDQDISSSGDSSLPNAQSAS